MQHQYYRVPAELVETVVERLLSASPHSPEENGSPLGKLPNSEIAAFFREMLENESGESPSLRFRLSPLSNEEEAQRDLLLRQIRLQTTKLTFRHPAAQLTA